MKKIFALGAIIVVSFIIGGSCFNLDIVSESDTLAKEISIACSRLIGGAERIRNSGGSKDELKNTATELCRSYKIKVYSFLDTHKADDYVFVSKIPYYYSRHRILSELRALISLGESIESDEAFHKSTATKKNENMSGDLVCEVGPVLVSPAKNTVSALNTEETKSTVSETSDITASLTEVKEIKVSVADIKADKPAETSVAASAEIKTEKPQISQDTQKEGKGFFSVRNRSIEKRDVPFAVVIEPLMERPVLGLSFASAIEEYTVNNKRKIIAYFTKKVPAVGPLGEIDDESAARLLKYKGLYAGTTNNEALGAFCVSEKSHPDLFWNASFYPEHANSFTNTEKINNAGIECSAGVQKYGMMLRDTIADGSDAWEVSVERSGVRYVYDDSTHSYNRIEDKTILADVSVKQKLSIASVVFMYPPVIDENGEGYGNYTALSNGKQLHGVWVKNTASDFMEFFDRAGNLAEFKSGLIWFQQLSDERITCAEQVKNVMVAKTVQTDTAAGGE